MSTVRFLVALLLLGNSYPTQAMDEEAYLREWQKYRKEVADNIAHRNKIMKEIYPKTWKERGQEIENARNENTANMVRHASETIYRRLRDGGISQSVIDSVLEVIRDMIAIGENDRDLIEFLYDNGTTNKQRQRMKTTLKLENELKLINEYIEKFRALNAEHSSKSVLMASELSSESKNLSAKAASQVKKILVEREKNKKDASEKDKHFPSEGKDTVPKPKPKPKPKSKPKPKPEPMPPKPPILP
ncbi:TPA: hypothetical protein ACMDV6_000589 [Vibrio parahaemolyticus]